MRILAFIIISLLPACTKKLNKTMLDYSIDVQGHRGYRGLYPENTIPGFIKAIEIGCSTLELDVVITGDNEVLVSHEAYFNHKITSLSDGNYIEELNERDYNIYKMKLSEIRNYDVGMKPHPNFPRQKKFKITKPTLNEVFSACEKFIKDNKLKKVNYNIEVKYESESFNPPPAKFVKLVLEVIEKNKLSSRCNIQSFSHTIMNETKFQNPKMKTAILIGDTLGIDYHLSKLTFTPDIYSPYFELVDEDLISTLKNKGIKIIPWTVNDSRNIRKLLNLNVDGIITDYPEVVIEILNNKE
jgi:glycerophosphoryl diester phosphodiesterase